MVLQETAYLRILSQSLKDITSDKPYPVGLLACQREPLLTELETTVFTINKCDPPKASAAKARSKRTTDDKDNEIYEVVLHDTVLFPEGGGQPADTGVMITQDGSTWEIHDVIRKGGTAHHFFKSTSSSTPANINVGDRVTVKLQGDSLARRWDHMSMHTAQHLVSALFEAVDIPTLSWSMTPHPTPSYIQTNRSPTPQQIESIQEQANRLAREATKVWTEVEDLAQDGPTGSIPMDYTGGVKRTIIIDGIDKNLCCGTHLPSLATLQTFIIPKIESGSGGIFRIYFVAGPRLVDYLAQVHSGLHRTALGLGCSVTQAPDRGAQEVDQRKKSYKRNEALETELAAMLAENFSREAAGHPVGQPFKKLVQRKDDSPNPLTLLNLVVQNFVQFMDQATSKGDYLLVLVSSPTIQTPYSVTTIVVAGSDEKLVQAQGSMLRTFGVKGGGVRSRWNGKWIGLWREQVEGEHVRKHALE